MEKNNSIESSLQKKIKQNDEKLKLLLNKGLYNNNFISSNNNNNNLSNQEDEDEIKLSNKNIELKKTEKPEIKKINTDRHNIIVKRNSNIKNRRAISQEKNHRKKIEESKKLLSSFNETIEQFKEDMKKRVQNLNNLKKEIEKNQKELYVNKSNNTKKNKQHYNEKIQENFLKRQKNFIDKKEQKREVLKNKIKIEEELKYQSAPTTKNKTNINEFIDNLEKWEISRKEKIKQMKKEQEEKIDIEFDHIPKINENSAKLVEKNKLRKNQPNTFERLAQQDKILKEKKKILIDMYTPSFKPFRYEPKNLNFKNTSKNFYFTEPNQLDFDEELYSDDRKSEKIDEDSNEEKEERDESEEIKDDEEFDYQQDIMKYTNKDVEDTLRNSLFRRGHHQKK